jgi:hypothetical protein
MQPTVGRAGDLARWDIRKDYIRYGGIRCLIISVVPRWKSQAIMIPSNFSFGGEFVLTDVGRRLDAFNSLATAAIVLAGFAFLLSCLPIWRPEEEEESRRLDEPLGNLSGTPWERK